MGSYEMHGYHSEAADAAIDLGKEVAISYATGYIGGKIFSPIAGKGWGRLAGFGDDAAIVQNNVNLIPKKGWYDVVVHGTEDGLGFTMNGSKLSAQQLYNKMLANGYQQGTKIRLMSCYSGSLPNGAAFQLSKLANASVITPTNSMWITNGQGFLHGGKLMVDNGGWFKFFK